MQIHLKYEFTTHFCSIDMWMQRIHKHTNITSLAHIQFPVHISMAEKNVIKKLLFDFHAPHFPGLVCIAQFQCGMENKKRKTITHCSMSNGVIPCVTHFREQHFIAWWCLMAVIVAGGGGGVFYPSFPFSVQWNNKNHCSESLISFVHKLIEWFDLISNAWCHPISNYALHILNVWQKINSISPLFL